VLRGAGYFISSSLKVLQSVASGQTNSSVSITKSAHSRHLNLTFYVETAYRRYQIGKCVILAINMPLCIGRPTIIWHHLTPKFVIGTQCICLREWQWIVLDLAKVVSEPRLIFQHGIWWKSLHYRHLCSDFSIEKNPPCNLFCFWIEMDFSSR
jgi:hypothetical protein